MKKWENDYLLTLFCGVDDLRPAMTQISNSMAYNYATDGSIAAKIHMDKCMIHWPEVEGYPDVESVFEKITPDTTLNITASELCEKIMAQVPKKKYKPQTCEECDGDGESLCHCCGNLGKCSECRGTGFIETNILILVGKKHGKIEAKHFDLNHLSMVLQVAKYTGVDYITYTSNSNGHSAIFKVGDFEILLMSKMVTES